MSEWKPIKSVPLGKAVLFYLPVKDSEGMRWSVWPGVAEIKNELGPGPSRLWIDFALWHDGGVGFVGNPTPTHWMPMPKRR